MISSTKFPPSSKDPTDGHTLELCLQLKLNQKILLLYTPIPIILSSHILYALGFFQWSSKPLYGALMLSGGSANTSLANFSVGKTSRLSPQMIRFRVDCEACIIYPHLGELHLAKQRTQIARFCISAFLGIRCRCCACESALLAVWGKSKRSFSFLYMLSF